jgi:hypothetical protein
VTDIRPEHKVVLIKIPRSAPVGADADALLEATSKWWVVAESRRNKGPAGPDFALVVNKGRVVAAYRIAGWRPAPTGHRWGFTGALSDELTALYGGVDVTRYFPPGAANPLRYVNCDTPKASAQRATAEREGYATKAASRGEAPLFWLLSLSDQSWTEPHDCAAGGAAVAVARRLS